MLVLIGHSCFNEVRVWAIDSRLFRFSNLLELSVPRITVLGFSLLRISDLVIFVPGFSCIRFSGIMFSVL